MVERVVTAETAAHLEAAGAVAADREGRRCLNLPVFYPFSQDLTAAESRLDLAQTVDSDADFYWRGTVYVETGGAFLLLVRYRLLSGYYLSNAAYPIAQMSKRAVTPELRIAAGGFIGIEATNNDVATRRLKIIFHGVKRYFLD
jgi:hypothetical protein